MMLTNQTHPQTRKPTKARKAISLVAVVLLALAGMIIPTATMADGTNPALSLSIAEVGLEGPAVSEIAVTVTNTSAGAVSDVTVEIGGPINWTLYPSTQTLEGLAAGASVVVTAEIHVPSNPSPTTLRRFTASATYENSAGARETVETLRLQQFAVPEVTGTLAELRNNVGTSTLETVASANYDGDGNSFSRELLAEQGATPGASLEFAGATFTWPDAAPGEPDNVSAEGQGVEIEGRGAQLAVLGSGLGAGASGQFVIHYTDGSASTGNIGFGNWFSATPAYGETVAIRMSGRNTPAGLANTEYDYGIYVSSMVLDPAKTVSVVVLPDSPGLHIFAMAFVEAPPETVTVVDPVVVAPECTPETAGEVVWETVTTVDGGGVTYSQSTDAEHLVTVTATAAEGTLLPEELPAGWERVSDSEVVWTYQLESEECAETPDPSITPTASPTATTTASPVPPTLPPGTDLYSTPGRHHVNGREWFTTCELYSQTYRCRTDIWATSVVREGAGYRQTNGWVFNNLTYLPMMTRAQWAGNPLGVIGAWTATDGRQWKTDCDSAATGRNGCRSYAFVQVVERVDGAGGAVSYRTVGKWVFNNIVRFR